jgi:hypothetical protein
MVTRVPLKNLLNVKYGAAFGGHLDLATKANSSSPMFCVTHVSHKKKIINADYKIHPLP